MATLNLWLVWWSIKFRSKLIFPRIHMVVRNPTGRLLMCSLHYLREFTFQGSDKHRTAEQLCCAVYLGCVFDYWLHITKGLRKTFPFSTSLVYFFRGQWGKEDLTLCPGTCYFSWNRQIRTLIINFFLLLNQQLQIGFQPKCASRYGSIRTKESVWNYRTMDHPLAVEICSSFRSQTAENLWQQKNWVWWKKDWRTQMDPSDAWIDKWKWRQTALIMQHKNHVFWHLSPSEINTSLKYPSKDVYISTTHLTWNDDKRQATHYVQLDAICSPLAFVSPLHDILIMLN